MSIQGLQKITQQVFHFTKALNTKRLISYKILLLYLLLRLYFCADLDLLRNSINVFSTLETPRRHTLLFVKLISNNIFVSMEIVVKASSGCQGEFVFYF